MPERFSFSDDRHREARLDEIKRYCAERLREEQEFLTGLTTQKLQAHYDQMFAGPCEDRVHALLQWARIVRKKHLLLPDVRHLVASVDSFPILRELVEHDTELQIRTAAAVALAHIFEYSQNSQVSRFLANLVLDESQDRALRLRCYVGLWTVNRDALRPKRKPTEDDRPRLKPTLLEYAEGQVERWRRFVEESRHFMPSITRANLSLEEYIRWDWVSGFTRDQ